jgi:predicted ferric reductase
MMPGDADPHASGRPPSSRPTWDRSAASGPTTAGPGPDWTGPEREPHMITATGTIPRVRLPETSTPGFREAEAAAVPDALHHEYVGDWGYRPIVPERIGQGPRWYFTIVFWFMLIASVEAWWLDTPGKSLHGVADVLIASGRVTGMVGGFLLLAQVLLMSRTRWLERFIGAHDLLHWHRDLGAGMTVLIVAHVVLITFGYAAGDGVSVLAETGSLWTTATKMISAYLATLVLVVIALSSIRALRRRMPYELWYYLHLSSYLVLLLGYGHQFADGQELSRGGFARWYWVALYVFVVLNLVQGRVVGPIRLNLRHRLRVAEVVAESHDMVSIYIAGERIEDLDVRAGQYFRWRFIARGHWWQAHPFSLSAAPNGRWLRLTVKAAGNHTTDLQRIRPGVRVVAEGPWGIFTAEHRRQPKALLIAGGSGIAPIRALMEELPKGMIVIYRARTKEEVIFRAELEWLAEQRDAVLWYVLGSRDDAGPRHAFSARGMREIAPDLAQRDVYLCGPPGVVDASLAALRRLRVPRRQIHLDPFEF